MLNKIMIGIGGVVIGAATVVVIGFAAYGVYQAPIAPIAVGSVVFLVYCTVKFIDAVDEYFRDIPQP